MGLKIGLVSPYGWNRPGGVREHIRHLAAQLTLLGHDVRLLAPGLIAENLLPEGHAYNMGWTFPFPINGTVVDASLDPALPMRVRELFGRETFDIVHIHEPLLPGLALAALCASNTVTVGTFHAYPRAGMLSVPSLGYATAAPLLRLFFRRLAGRIAVSSVASQFISHFFPADYRVIPNGVDLERFNPQVAPIPDLMDGRQNVLFVGRFDKRKGAEYLIQSIPLVREFHPHTRFLFVGEGHLRGRLQELVQQQSWRDVVFTGYAPEEVLPRYFASAHIFCAPATGCESMGIVLLEAMASGIPIVATNIPGYATVVESGVDGLLTPPRNSQELATAIIQLLGNQSLRQKFVMKGLRKVDAYAWPRVAQQIMDYYVQLLKEHVTSSRG